MKRLLASAVFAAGLTAAVDTAPAEAQTEPFIAQIQFFAGNFCPRGWAVAGGQTLPIASHTALFSLIGCTFGGDCRTTLQLPNLLGRTPINVGTGPGLSPHRLGERGGNYQMSISAAQTPSHTHSGTVNATTGPANNNLPTNNRLATGALYQPATPFNGNLQSGSATTVASGGQQPFNTMQPYLPQIPCIALEGQYPSRS